MAYPGLAHEEHKYLGKEYCTGYTDVYGKWNTGFYCPQYGSKTAVFCCGTAVFKYCCTNQEPIDPNSSSGVLLDGDDPNFDGDSHHGVSSAVFVRVPVVFGVVCGIAAVLVLLIVAACYFCSCCFAYKKRRNDHMGHNDLPRHLNHLHLNHAVLPAPPPNLAQTGLYRNSSTPSTTSTITASSNLLNLYSGGTGGSGPLTSSSLVTTPLDLDWASSIASTYQSQQTLFPPPAIQFTPSGPGPGNALTPAAAATLAVALSQQQQRHSSPAANSLLGGGSGPPSIISGTTLNTSTGRIPSVSQAYQSFLNSSTSTLSSNSVSSAMPPRGLGPPQPQLHRANLPQQISTTASIVNSYLASLQQQQQQQQQAACHVEPQPPPVVAPPPLPPVERTRHPSPPPSYFQTVSSASYHGGSNNSNNNYMSNNRNSRSSNQNRQNRMATIQSILGSGSGAAYTGNTTWNNEDDLLLAEFIMRHENTLRRSLGLTNNNNRNGNNGGYNNGGSNNMNAHNNSSSNSSSARGRGNPMLTQRELIELLLRLTYHSSSTAPLHNSSSSTASSIRSDSRAGSESHSTASSAATTRSTASAASATSTNGKVNNGSTTSCTKLTINEVDEDDSIVATGQEGNNGGSGGKECGGVVVTMRNPKTSCLDLSLSRLSVGENDSGVASSTCSTVGSEVAESVIGSIKMISRDLSEEAMKLKKQPHAVDDDGLQRHQKNVKVVVHEEDETIAEKMKEKLHEQQLAASIHPERNCETGDSDECTSGGEESGSGMMLVPVPTANNGEDDASGAGGDLRLKGNKSGVCIEAGSGSDGEIIEICEGRDGNGNTNSCSIAVPLPPPPLMGGVVSCENSISATAAPQL